MDGGPGSDTIDGGGGRDELRGGEPADEFEHDFIRDGERDGSVASDTIVAHPGQATLSYASRRKRVVVDLPAGVAGAPGEHDSVDGITAVVGGRGPDIMIGRNRFEFFRGGAGADRLVGRGGDDLLYGQRGPDRVLGKAGDDRMSENADNARDVLSCGHGHDAVHISDKRDLLRPACEDGAWSTARDPAGDELNWITAHPILGRGRAIFRSTCSESPRCRGRIVLKAPGNRRSLGSGRFRFRRTQFRDARTAPRRRVVARLNKRGRNHVRRERNVRVVIISRRDCSGCTNRPPAVKTGFTIDMRR